HHRRGRAARCAGARCLRRARRQQRERGGGDGRDDRRLAPVRDPDEAPAERGAERPARGAAARAGPLKRRNPAMMRSLAIAKTGLEAQQTQLDAITHNLANVGTNGYKRSRAVFEDLMYQNIRQAGGPTTEETPLPVGLQLGSGVRAVATSRNFTQGSLTQTDNQMDLAINGQGFFQVQMPDGSIAYTR